MPDTGPAANHLPADSGTVELSLLLVTFNSSGVLDGLIQSLRRYPPGCRWELIVADNASSDDSVLRIEKNIEDASIIRQETNRGFASAVNAAGAAARGEYLALINPDIAWDSDPFAPLLRQFRANRRIGAITPQLVFPDGHPQLSIRRFPTHQNIWWSRGTPWGRLFADTSQAKSYTLTYPDEPAQIDAAAAACIVIRKPAFDGVGGMDEGYFLYVEDTDFCRRLRDAGWEVWCDPRVVVRHAWNAGSQRDAWHARMHRRGIRRYFRKFFPGSYLKNAVLFGALTGADILSLFSPRGRRQGTR